MPGRSVCPSVEADESWADGGDSLWTLREALSVMKVPDRDVAPQRLQVVLLSLCVMAVSIVYRPDEELEGGVSDALAFGLHQVLRGNPQFRAFITGDPVVIGALPDEVVIGGLTYVVGVDESFAEAANAYAAVNTHVLKIKVRVRDVSPQRIQIALLHELIHAISKVYGSAGEELKEEWVKSLAYGLYQVFRDNPGVLAYVTAADAAPVKASHTV